MYGLGGKSQRDTSINENQDLKCKAECVINACQRSLPRVDKKSYFPIVELKRSEGSCFRAEKPYRDARILVVSWYSASLMPRVANANRTGMSQLDVFVYLSSQALDMIWRRS